MSRIRSVHPGLFTDEAFMAASVYARLLVIGLWTEADDQGVFEWKPLTLKARLLPVDGVDVAALLQELELADFVRRFDVDGKTFGAVRNFRKFQRPQKPTPRHPLPEFIRSYVGLSSTPTVEEPEPDDRASRKSPQMEGVGDKREGGNGRKSYEIEKTRPVVASLRDPVLADPDNPLAYYSEGEIAVLALEEGPDTEDRICELWRWAWEKGERNPNVIKRMVSGRMAKDAKARREAPALREQMENPPPLTISSEVSSSRLARKNVHILDRRKQA